MSKKDPGVQAVTQSVIGSIKKIFEGHRNTVRRMNEEKREKLGIKP